MTAVFRAVLAALLCVVALVIPPAAVAADSTRAPNFSAEAVLLVDPDGRVLYAKNADNERAPASLVNHMTLYLACEALDAGRVYARHIPRFSDPGGVQALKTGFTQEAGYNLAVSAWRGGQQFLMIVLGARTRALSFLDAKKLLHYGFVETGLEPEAEKPAPGRKSIRARRATATRPAR